MSRASNRLVAALKLTSAAVALSALSATANAADCFDRRTENPKAGNATAVIGPDVGVKQSAAALYARPQSGADVYTGDEVRTGAQSHLQLKLCDWSTYTFSPESQSRINEFYDSEGALQRRLVNYVRGGFRLASGRNTTPGSTEVAIQESGVTMGVRGTNVILVELDGFVYALLEGPAVDNSGLSPQGRVEFWTDENREEIEARLTRPGWAVRIGPDGVSEPFHADDALLQRIYEAFVPAFPDDGDPGATGIDPGEDSGQEAQEGEDGVDTIDDKTESDTDNNETNPDSPGDPRDDDPPAPPGPTDPDPPNPPDPTDPTDPTTPPPGAVGAIFTLAELEGFAAAQASPDGHVFALAPARLLIDTGSGPQLAESGVVMIQLNFDFATRKIAPEALASFVKYDFSVSDPANLTIGDGENDILFRDAILEAFVQALLAGRDISFSAGESGVAVFPNQLFTVTVKKGPGQTATVDVALDFKATDPLAGQVNVLGEALGLQIMPGKGDLAYFPNSLADILSISELTGTGAGVRRIFGYDNSLTNTLGQPGSLPGVSYGQLQIDFGARTIGGPGSFLFFTAAAAPAIGGQQANAYLPLDRPIPFSSGLFNLAFYPLAGLTTGGALVAGQAMLGQDPDFLAIASIAAILRGDSGAHLYSSFDLDRTFDLSTFPLATLAELDSVAGTEIGAESDLFFNSDNALTKFARLSTPNGDFTGLPSAHVDIHFGNRTFGGGSSFLGVSFIDPLNGQTLFSFNEFINQTSFDAALAGQALFALDSADISGGDLVHSMIFMLRNEGSGPPAGLADIYFSFTDGAGGEGVAELRGLARQELDDPSRDPVGSPCQGPNCP